MARLNSQNLKAPSGVDVTSDPVAMTQNRARLLINFQVDRHGLIYARNRLADQLVAGSIGTGAPIDGVGYYYNATFQNAVLDTVHSDLLLWVLAGFMVGGTPAGNPLTGTVTNASFAANAQFFVGKRVRFAYLIDEAIIVQDGGINPVRFYATAAHGTGIWHAGLFPPTGSGVNANLLLADAGAHGGLPGGTWGYKLTFEDEHGRESSPTEAVNITLVAGHATRATLVTPVVDTGTEGAFLGGPDNAVVANLYRNTLGAPDVFYRIARTATLTPLYGSKVFPAFSYFYDNNAYDDAPDVSIVGGQLAPNPGEYDSPNPASVIAVHKNRVFLNDVSDNTTLQVSVTLSTTQYTSVPESPTIATDGVRLQVGTDQGDPINALVEFGSVLAIFKRRGCWFLYGNDLSDFLVQPVHERGCTSPDSAVRCDNAVLFLSDDGVYAASYNGGDLVTKISKEIEVSILSHTQAERETSVGWYFDRCYFLSIGDTIYGYSFDSQGWFLLQFGSGSIVPGEGVPPVLYTQGVGFSHLDNSALFGSLVPEGLGCGGSVSDGGGCSVSVDPSAASVSGAGGTFAVAVTADNLSGTPYFTSAPWLHVSGPGQGSGTATILVDPNTTCFVRTGTVTICSATVTVTQDRSANCDCMITSLTPDTFNVDHTAQTVQTVYVEDGTAAITEQALVAWLHPHTPVPATGAGTIDIDVDANTTCAERTGQVQICDKFVTVTQAADPGCGCSVVITNDLVLHIAPGQVGNWVIEVLNANDTPYACTTDAPGTGIVINSCSGDGVAGPDTTTLTYNAGAGGLSQDVAYHVFLCNAIWTIIADQHS